MSAVPRSPLGEFDDIVSPGGEFDDVVAPTKGPVAAKSARLIAAGMGAEKEGRTVAPGIMEAATQGGPMRRMQQAGEAAVAGVQDVAPAILEALSGRQPLANTFRALLDALSVPAAGFAPMTSALGSGVESATGSQAAGDVAEMLSVLPMGKVAPGLFGLGPPEMKMPFRPLTGLYTPSAEMEAVAAETKPLDLLTADRTPSYPSSAGNRAALDADLAAIDRLASTKGVVPPVAGEPGPAPTIVDSQGRSMRSMVLDDQLAKIDRKMQPTPPTKRVFNVEPSNATEMGRVRYAERGPAGLLGAAPEGTFIPEPVTATLDPVQGIKIVGRKGRRVSPKELSATMPPERIASSVEEAAAPRIERPLPNTPAASKIVAATKIPEEPVWEQTRAETVSPTRTEISSAKSAAQERGVIEPADLPEVLAQKIAARNHLAALADTLEHGEGVAGRKWATFDELGTKTQHGVSSVVPEALQGSGKDYGQMIDIIARGLRGETNVVKNRKGGPGMLMSERQFWNKAEAWAIRRDGPPGEREIQEFLAEHGLNLPTKEDLAAEQARGEAVAEREGIAGEQGSTDFPTTEPTADERAARAIMEAGVAVPPEVLEKYPSLRKPVEEFSPAASEAQRLAEERDVAAGRKPTPGKPAVQGSLGLSEDAGRKGDQQEFMDILDAAEFEAGKAPLGFGSRVTYRAGKGGPVPAERYYSRSLHEQNRGIFNMARGPFAEGGLHGIHQLSRAAPELAQALVTVEASTDMARQAVVNVAQLVEEAGGEGAWRKFVSAMIESSRRGMSGVEGAERGYAGLSDKVAAMTPEQVIEEYGSTPYGIAGRLGAISDTKVFSGRRIAETGDKLFAENRGPELRAFLTGAFREAAANVGSEISDAEYKAIRAEPWFLYAHELYTENFAKPFEESHLRNEGVPLQFPGDLGYYPLISKGDAERKLGFMTKYGRPRNLGNVYRTGLSQEYDHSTQGLLEQASRAYRSNNMAQAFRVAEDAGLLKYEGPQKASPVFEWNRTPYTAGRLERYQTAIVPEWVKDEWDPIIKKTMPNPFERVWNPRTQKYEMHPTSMLGKAAAWTTHTYIQGPMEGIAHGINLAGFAISKIPFLGTSPGGRALSNVLTRMPATLLAIIKEPVTGKDVQASLRDMARSGWFHPRQYSTTWSKKYADLTGSQRVFSFSPMLYGPHSIDLKVRMLARRLALATDPNISQQKLWEYGNHFGQYHQGLADNMTRALKKTGLAPFATATATGTKSALETLTGTGTLPGGVGTRIWNIANGSAWGLTGAWIAAYKAYTRMYPWEDPRMKLFQIPLNPDDRSSPWAVSEWGPPETGDAYINFGRLLNPAAERMGRATGIRGASETLARGGTGGQAFEAGIKDVVNTALTLISGPYLRLLTRLGLGVDPRIMSIRESGRAGVVLQPAVRDRAEPGIETLQKRLESLPGAFNPMVEREEQWRTQGSPPLRELSDTFLPNIFTGPTNIPKQQRYLIKRLRESRRPNRHPEVTPSP